MSDNEQLNVNNEGETAKEPSRQTSKQGRGASQTEKSEKTERASKSERTRKVTRPKKPENRQAYMYLGPNLPGGILFNGGVHKEIPEYLNGVIVKIPDIEKLFVEVKDAPAFKAELTRQGSEPYRLRQNVVRLIDEGALKNGGI